MILCLAEEKMWWKWNCKIIEWLRSVHSPSFLITLCIHVLVLIVAYTYMLDKIVMLNWSSDCIFYIFARSLCIEICLSFAFLSLEIWKVYKPSSFLKCLCAFFFVPEWYARSSSFLIGNVRHVNRLRKYESHYTCN